MTDHRRFRYPRIGEGGPRICQDTAHSPWFLQRASIASSKFAPADIRHRIEMSSAPRSCSSRRMACATTRSRHGSIPHGRSSASGVIASSRTASRGLRKSHAAGARPAFPPGVVVAIKRMACEAPSVSGVPLARWSIAELQREAMGRGLVATVGATTLWRWLNRDAMRPWRHRSWLFPRDPDFTAKASPILRSVRRPVAGQTARFARLRALGRREDQHSSPSSRASLAAAPAWPPRAGGARVRATRRLGLPGGLGRSTRASVRPVRGDHGDCPLRPPRRAGHGPTTVSHRLKRPQFSWTLIRGESNVQGGGGNGSIEERAGEGVGGDGGSPEGDRSARRRRGR